VPLGVAYHHLVGSTHSLSVANIDIVLHYYSKAALEPRESGVLVNFANDNAQRHQALARFQSSIPLSRWLWLPDQTPFWDVWYATITRRFVLSPPGHGADCYRHWEALIMGAIPILLRSSMFDQLFDGWPVVQVDSWDEITSENLTQWARQLLPIQQQFYSNASQTAKLTSRYWMKQVLLA
jgi:hypothetical protein